VNLSLWQPSTGNSGKPREQLDLPYGPTHSDEKRDKLSALGKHKEDKTRNQLLVLTETFEHDSFKRKS